MNQKIRSILKLTIFCLLVLSIESLSIKQNHQKVNHDLVQVYVKKTQHKLGSLFNIENSQKQEDRQISTDFLQEFMAFIFSDKQISDSIFKGTPLSKQATDRIKNFFLSSESFNDLLLQLLDEDPKAPQCYLDMEESKKRKVITTIIQQYDLFALLNQDSTMETTNSDQIEKIKNKISNDSDLGPSAVQCLNKNPNFLLLLS